MESIKRVPYIPLRGQTFFPGTIVGFDIGRDKSLAAVDLAMNGDKYIVVSSQRDPSVSAPKMDDCYMTGVIVRVRQVVKKNEDYVRILVVVEQRVRIEDIYEAGDLLMCDYTPAEDYDNDTDDISMQANIRVLRQLYMKYLELTGQGESAGRTLIDDIDDPSLLCSLIANEIDVAFDIKQTLLEIDSVKLRVGHLVDIIGKENNILSIAKRINNRVVKNMNRGQREYYLREQLQVIKEELGEDEDTDDEARQWREKLDELKLEEKTDTKVRKEIDKFTKMSPMSPDANVSRTYIETILDLPWHKANKINRNINKAEKILNEDHYGLEKVKERILECLAVQHLTKNNKGPIICLVGPPGVGKTSIAKSIARATNREFVRMSLGGVRDEAEIRGHRRTYIGAIPGRVINGISESGTNNPLFLFDEVDKIGSDFRGDPASALLEVLDPEQNSTFTDHYLEIPFDLSDVMFITTANTTATIPAPLLDRMEVIELTSYTEEEKVHIATGYLVPKKMKENGLKKSQFSITSAAIRDIIEYYTREAGVRNLEREIGNACRKAARNIVSGKQKKNNVTPRNLRSYLGKRIFIEDIGSLEPEVGVTTGMAWTTVGGVTLTIETVKMPGTGKLILTGQMGDVMRESATTALGYIKSISGKYKIGKDVFKDYDIQIHIPEGATPKDGPSAGITMCSALFSLLTDRKADKTVAMTGEITLRGKVLRIGGLKEKSLAAYRQGIRRIIIPKENEPDLEDIPASVRKEVEFIPVADFEEVIPVVIQ
ncbi:MAG: endopeptidase La [Mogibacterium sp.]|nr:endopeptidase La [Mogibacterium sp.]MBQ6501381.1 endopeptidase La [Mogibacterium sp.]